MNPFPELEDGPLARGRGCVLAFGALALVVLVVGLATTPRYGITSDEPVAYYGSEWQLWALGSDHPDRWKFKQNAPAEFERTTVFNTHPDPLALRVPAFPALFAVATSGLFEILPGYERVDAVHAGLVLLHALTLFAFGLYLSRLLGLRRALLATALFALYPSVVGHAHYNVKDLPMAGFYALTLLSFATGILENRSRFILHAAFWLGLALSSKANGLFAAITLVLWLPFAAWLLYREGRLPSRRVIAATCLIPELTALTVWASWPYLWVGGLRGQWDKIVDLMQVLMRFAATPRAGWSSYSLVTVSAMTPPIVLVGLLAAVWVTVRASPRERTIALLTWIWLLLPIVRIALPHSNYYDGNRLFFEYAPALAVLSAMGLDWMLERAVGWVRRRRPGWEERARVGGLAFIVVLLAWPVVQYHPYESTYYNLFVGGLGGAQQRRLTARHCRGMEFYCPDSESDYWGFSYREAIREVNRVADRGAAVLPCGNLLGPLTRFQGVRPDLRVVGSVAQAEYFVVIPRGPFCSEDERRYVREHAEPVLEERRDGGLVFGVYRRRG